MITKLATVAAAISFSVLAEESWPQFRGPNSAGVSPSVRLPSEFVPSKNAIWKLSVPAGKSSPVFAGNRIFLTGHDGDRLLTLCADKDSGQLLWQREIRRTRQEKRNKLNDAAAPSPVTDGRNVYAFFADFGLAAYTAEGTELWRVALPPMPSMQGVSGSPLLAGNRLILVVDQAQDSYMLAVDTRNGETIWRKERGPAPGGAYSSPVLFTPAGSGEPQLITFSPFELAAFSISNGEKLWWVRGLPPQPKSTPLVADGVIYCYARSFFGDALPVIPVFSTVLEQNDANKDGRIQKEEAPEGPARTYFGIVDRNKDGSIDATEWDGMMEVAAPKSTLLAVKPAGRGDITDQAVLWRYHRNIPDVPMPVVYRGVLYMVQNGGILTAFDPMTGDVRKQARLTGALGDYYASPVAADGRIYILSQEGKLVVVRAGADWEVTGISDLEEECYATPAIVGGAMYVRAGRTFYRFEAKP